MIPIDPWLPRTIILSIATEKQGTTPRAAVLANYVAEGREVVTVAQDVGAMWPTVGRVLDECPRIGKIKQIVIYTNDEDFLKVFTPPIKLALGQGDNEYWHWLIGRRLFVIPKWRLVKMDIERMKNTTALLER